MQHPPLVCIPNKTNISLIETFSDLCLVRPPKCVLFLKYRQNCILRQTSNWEIHFNPGNYSNCCEVGMCGIIYCQAQLWQVEFHKLVFPTYWRLQNIAKLLAKSQLNPNWAELALFSINPATYPPPPPPRPGKV